MRFKLTPLSANLLYSSPSFVCSVRAKCSNKYFIHSFTVIVYSNSYSELQIFNTNKLASSK